MTKTPRKSALKRITTGRSRATAKGGAHGKQAAKLPPSNPPSHDPIDDFIGASALALGLPVERSWRRKIREHLKVTLQHGELVAEFVLPDAAEPAPVFEA